MNSKNSDGLFPLSADLHIHSALSSCAEGGMTPDKILKKVIGLGIDVFAITDHNSGFNCAAFHAAAKERNILFIPGIELQSSEEIHLLGYFPDTQALERFCTSIVTPRIMKGMKNDPSRFGNQTKISILGNIIGEEEDMLSMPLSISIEDLVDQVHEFDGIAVAAHLDRGFSVISQLGYIPPQLGLDAVEVRDPNEIERIRSEFLGENDLNIISSSDSHYIDMMRAPSMKLWLKNSDVISCLNCIRGDGPGRITIRKRGRRTRQRDSESGLDPNARPSKRDWKDIYK